MTSRVRLSRNLPFALMFDGLRSKMSLPPRIILTLFFLTIAAGGLFGTASLGEFFFEEAPVYLWRQTPCLILSSRILDKNTPAAEVPPEEKDFGASGFPYAFSIAYSYEFKGKTYQSSSIKRGYHGTSDYNEAQRQVLDFPAGGKAFCYVNPAQPEQAVLLRDKIVWAIPFFIIIPLMPLFLGGGAIYMIWAPLRRRAAANSDATAIRQEPKYIPAQRSFMPSFVYVAVFFLLMGLGFFIPFGAYPVWRYVSAQRWPAVPCAIVSSNIAVSSDDEGGSSYIPAILYSYEISGREYRSNRYGLPFLASPSQRTAKDIIKRLPPGSHAVCYVNPSDPCDSVLSQAGDWTLLFGLVPLVFVAVGGLILYYGLARRLRHARR